jgi:arginine exporter protein ArgO
MKITKETIDIICTILLISGLALIIWGNTINSNNHELADILKWVGVSFIVINGVNSINNLYKMKKSRKY